MKRSSLIAAVVLMCLAGCSSSGNEAATARPALAEVNGQAITVEQLGHRMSFLDLGFSNLSGGDHAGDAKIEALSQLIDEAIYLQEAGRLGISTPPDEVDAYIGSLAREYPEGVFDTTLEKGGLTMKAFRQEVARKLTMEKLIEAEVYSSIGGDEARLRSYYEGHKDEFRHPTQVRARQIVVDSEGSARAVLKEIKAGADFAAVARERSLSPDGEMGGDLGYFSRGDMPTEFEEVVFRMKPGEMSGVVHTPYGYHIFLVEDSVQAATPGFDEVRDLVRKRFLAAEGEDAYAAWQAGLRERASIEVHTEALAGL